MVNARDYLKKIIVDKSGEEWDGNITLAAKNNILRDINWIAPIMEDYAREQIKNLNLASIKGSGFKDEMSRSFAAGREMQKCNKLTYWDDDKEKDVEHSGFNGWFNHHYL